MWRDVQDIVFFFRERECVHIVFQDIANTPKGICLDKQGPFAGIV
jgi:hypothetical protein